MKQAHTEKATCTICGKQVRALKDHMASVHTSDSEKQFHCEHCGKGFGNQRSLNDHMNIHLDIRPYACREGCGLSYNDSANRDQHERRVHGVRGGWQRPRKKVKRHLEAEESESDGKKIKRYLAAEESESDRFLSEKESEEKKVKAHLTAEERES